MKKKENQLNEEDRALFRQAMGRVKPLVVKKVRVKPPPPPQHPQRRKPMLQEEEISSPAAFSDQDYLDPVESETVLEFARPGFSNTLLRELRRGKQAYQAILDLHGKTVDEARQALHHFILVCCREGQTVVLVVHGKGQGKKRPILKNKLNHWLRESEAVLAFCSAQKQDGGRGALYLRLRIHKKKPLEIDREAFD